MVCKDVFNKGNYKEIVAFFLGSGKSARAFALEYSTTLASSHRLKTPLVDQYFYLPDCILYVATIYCHDLAVPDELSLVS